MMRETCDRRYHPPYLTGTTGLASSGERLRVLDLTATWDRA